MSAIWDSCNALTAYQRYWRGENDDGTPATLVVDGTVVSPIGGSIRGNPAADHYNFYMAESWDVDAFMTLDLSNPASRPKSVYVRVSRTMPIAIQLVDRIGGGWNPHEVVPLTTVQANTLTELVLDYSGLSAEQLVAIAQLTVVAQVQNLAASVWVSGITSGGTVTPPPPLPGTIQVKSTIADGITPTPVGGHFQIDGLGPSVAGPMALTQSGATLVDGSGKEVLLRGTMDFWPNYVSSHIFNLNGTFNSTKVNTALAFIKSQGGNFLRIFISADWVLNNPGSFMANLNSLLTLAENNGVYVMCVFSELTQGAGGYENELPYDPYIIDSGWTTARFNQACAALASNLKNHPNALQELWNEPMRMDEDAYYTVFWNNVPSTITAIRNAGFTGIICVNGEVSFAPGYDKSGMIWAVEHPNIFGPGKNVMATFHAYYRWLQYPTNPTQLFNLWFTQGRITEARNKGIPVMYDETGTIRDGSGDEAAQNNALTVALQVCVDNKLHFAVMDFSSPYGGEELLNNENTPFTSSTWNSTGLILAAAWQRMAALVPSSIKLSAVTYYTTPYGPAQIALGGHTVHWLNDMTGFVAPIDQNVSVVAEQNSLVNGIFAPANGTFTVETTPAGGTFKANGAGPFTAPYGPVNATPGAMTIVYQPRDGYTTPVAETKQIVAGQNTDFTGGVYTEIPPAKGTITIQTLDNNEQPLQEAILVNKVQVAVGSYTHDYDPNTQLVIDYGDDSTGKYITPASDTATILEGQHIFRIGIYNPKPPPTIGTFTVETNPAGGTFKANGAGPFTAPYGPANASAGQMTIVYLQRDGYTTPPAETKTIVANQNTDFTGGNYVLIPPAKGTITRQTLDNNGQPVQGPILINGVQVAVNYYHAEYDPGAVLNVTYGDLLGYTTPAGDTATIVEGQDDSKVGIYNLKPTPVSRSVVPAIAIGSIGIGGGYGLGGGSKGALVGAAVGITTGIVVSILPGTTIKPPAVVACIKCQRAFQYTSFRVPIWCPYCHTEQIVRR